jgi:hypothetical protein
MEDGKCGSSLSRVDADAEEQRASGAPQAAGSEVSEVAIGGGCLSNTHPQASHPGYADIVPGCHVSGGFDWLAWAASVQWNPLSFSSTMAELEEAKLKCQEKKEEFQWMDLVGLGPIRVFRQGFNRGGDAGQHFEFKLSYKDVAIGLARLECGTKWRANLFACMRGRDCLLLGAREGYDIVREFIRRLAGEIQWEQAARADFSLDIARLDVVEIQEAAERGQFITAARNVAPWTNLVGHKKSGLSVGKRPLHLTVYDKLAQVLIKSDVLYRQAMQDRRWDGELPDKATRVEFQASRQWLLNQGVDSPDDLFRLAGAVVAKLTGEWFRLTAKPVDRENNNQGRAETLALWEQIQLGFARVFGEPNGQLIPIERERIHPERLIRQGRGCLANAMLQMGRRCETFDDFVFSAVEVLQRSVPTAEDAVKFIEDYRRRITEFAA